MQWNLLQKGRVVYARWAVAGACVLAALVLRLALAPWLEERAPFLAFAPAAMLAAWYGGFWPGMLVTIAGALLSDTMFVPPLGVHSGAEAALMATYLVTALAGVIACGALHHSRERLRQASQQLSHHAATLEQELAERRRAEQTVREMERLARRVIDANVIGIAIADFQGNLIDSNDALLDLIGYERADLEAGRLNFIELTPPELHHLDQQAVEQLRLHGKHAPYEKALLRQDGSRVPVLMGIAIVPGTPDIGIGYVVDLTPQKRAEAVVLDSERRLRLLTDAMPALVSYVDRQMVYQFVNRAYKDWFGQNAEEVLGRTVREVVGEPAFERIERYFRQALAGEATEYEAEVPYKLGGTRFVRAHYVPDLAEDGAVRGVYVMVQDLTARHQTEAALRQSERRFAAFMENLPGAAWMKDLQGRYVYVNAEAQRVFRKSLADLLGRTDAELFSAEAAAQFSENDRRVVALGSLTTTEVLRHEDGVDHHSLVSKFLIPGHDKQAMCVGGVAIDITSRLAAEQALRQSEQRFRGFANNSDDVLWIADPHTRRLVYVSPSFERVHGWPATDIYRDITRFTEYVHEADRARVVAGWTRCMEAPHAEEYRVIRPDGSVIWVRDRGFPIFDDAGKLQYVAGIAEDITEQKRAATALHESEKRYRFLAESIPQIVFTARADGVVNYHNEQLLNYLGTTRAELAKLGWIHFRHADDRLEATRRWNHAIATGEPYECMYRMRRGSDQSWRWHLARAIPMRDETGQVVMWFGTCTDIDDQKRAQDALVESEQEFRAVFELSGSGKAMVDPPTGRFVRVNRKLCDMLGYSAQELLAKTFSEVTHPDDRDWSARESGRMMRGEIPVYAAEKRYIRKDGQVIWVHIIASLIRDAQGNPLRAAGVIQDITERKRAEESLRQSEATLARAQRIAGLGSWEHDFITAQGCWSDEMYRLYGVSRDEFVPTMDSFFSFVPPEEHEPIKAAVERAIRNHTTYHFDHRIVLRDGTVRHVSEQAEIVYGVEGEPLRMIGTTLDITERKRYEEELAAASRAKDQFLAMLSHELRTPLTPVVLAIDALRTDAALPARVRDDLEMIHRNVGLEAKLIDDLLDLTRVARGKLELHRQLVDLHAALSHAVRSCCGGADGQEKRLTVRLDLSARDAQVRADGARLEQVFFNLLRNAVKFTPAGGAITVCTRDSADGRLRIEITDTGVGIEPHVLPRLFKAFEQGDRAVTRNFGGLGLGLAICKAIVELHGGSIHAHSDGLNRGATFAVELPLAAADATAAQPQTSPPAAASAEHAPTTAKPRILLVEDHEPTAAMMMRLFNRLGYDIQSAGDIATAQRLAEDNSFDLMISDLGLPDGTGLDLMRHVRDRYGLKGIALSGFGMEEDLIQSKAAGFVEHLVKPISFDQLQLSIQRVMGAAKDGDSGSATPELAGA